MDTSATHEYFTEFLFDWAVVMNNTYDYINSIDMISQRNVMCIHSKYSVVWDR